MAASAAALIPGAVLAIVEQAGHWAPLEQPEEVAQHMRRWLDPIG